MKLRDKLKEHLREAALIGVAIVAIVLLEYEGFIEKRNKRGGY